jgi:hypothetical protein
MKHIGPVRFEDISVEAGLSMGAPLKDWIQASLDLKHERKDGEIRACDYDYKIRNKAVFQDALLTEIAFPALDAASSSPAAIGVTFAPESVEFQAGDGSKLVPATSRGQKAWLASNFRVEIGGLPCNRVSKVDALTWKVQTTDVPGGQGQFSREPGEATLSNLKLTISTLDAKPWLDWFDDFVIKGNNQQANELTGAIVNLAPNKAAEIARLDLAGVGIRAIEIFAPDPSPDPGAITKFRVELYVEQAEFTIK